MIRRHRIFFAMAALLAVFTSPLPKISLAADVPFPKNLLDDLRSKDQSIRLSAVQAIKPYRELTSIPVLERILVVDPDTGVKIAAAVSLGQLKEPASREGLINGILFDSSGLVRFRCGEALSMLGVNRDEKQAFLRGLEDPDKRVRYISLHAISSKVQDSDISLIADLLADDSTVVRELAHQILSKRGIVLEKIGDRYRMVK